MATQIYPWDWQRGPNLTVFMDIGASDLELPHAPVGLAANLVIRGAAAGELLGVCPSKPIATTKRVAITISNDVYQVQVASGVNLGLGDPVQLLADGSVTTLAGGYVVGYVVDYNPLTSGIAHIMARPSALATAGLNDAALALPLAGGTLSGNLIFGDGINIATNATTGTKIGTAASQKIGFYNAAPVVQAAHAAALKVNYTTGDLDIEAEVIAALNATNTEINRIQVILENLGLRASA